MEKIVIIEAPGIFLEIGHNDYLCGSPFPDTNILQIRHTVLGDIEIDEYRRLGFETYYKLVEYLEANGHPGIHTASPITIVYHTNPTKGASKS